MRWSPCWYGQAAVNRRDTGSIPVAAAESQWKSSGWMRNLPRKQARTIVRCGFESHGFRLMQNNLCPWPSGKGVSLPSWTGGFDSRRALLIGSVAQRQSRCLLSTRAWVRVPPFPLSLRGSRCWQRCWALTPEAQVRFLPPQFVNFSNDRVSFDAESLRDSRCW